MVQSGKNIEVTRLIPGYVYQFSDYLPHVVVNPPEQTIELITLDKFDR
jgi:hypothetical protein